MGPYNGSIHSAMIVAVIALIHLANGATVNPILDECLGGIADVVFVIDESGSIGEDDWGKAMEFFADVINYFTVASDRFRISAITFGDGEAEEHFDLNDHTDYDAVIAALNGITYDRDSHTNIAAGLKAACDMFDPSKGDRLDANDVVMLFTDGEANQDMEETLPAAEALKTKGVSIICVIVQDSVDVDFLDQLKQIASEPGWVMPIEEAFGSGLVSSRAFQRLHEFVIPLALMICRAVPGVDHCIRCKDYDENNYGYVADRNSSKTCYLYYICRLDPETGKSVKVHARQCPIGTRFELMAAIHGNPCVPIDAHYDEECEDHRVPEEIAINLKCPYRRSVVNPSEFGYPDGSGGLMHVQNCGAGGFFDHTDGVCTCIVQTSNCPCLLWIDFTGDFQGHCCNGGWVGNSVPPVQLVPGGTFGQGGYFGGLVARYQNGAHLTTHVIDGAFSPTCDGQFGQHELTVALWFNDQNDGLKTKTSGLVNYCDSIDGPSVFIEIRGNRVCAGLKTINHFRKEMCSTRTILTNRWYYTALVYDDPNLTLYVTDVDDYFTCTPPFVPGPTCFPAATATQTGCVEPRNCGFDVGVTSRSWMDDQFFKGLIDDVQVSREARYNACR